VLGLYAQQPPAAEPERILEQALALHQSGDTEGAIRAYREYLEQRPDSIQARSNLGTVLVRAGRYDEAIVEYNRALAGGAKNPLIVMNLALAYFKSDRIAEAAARLEEAMRMLDQPNRQVTLLLADCYLRLGRNADALALLTPLEKDNLEDPAFNYLLGTALIGNGQSARGGQVVDRILRRGDSAEARFLLGTIRSQAGELEKAMEEFKKAIELNPRLPEAHTRLGEALLSNGDSAGAAAAFHQELEFNPGDFTANLRLGVFAKRDQDYDEARRYLDRALQARPGDPGVRYQIATLDLSTGKLEQARESLEALVKESPGFTEAHGSLATVYYRLHRTADAERERGIVEKLSSVEGTTASRNLRR
jgi:Flp pilus assembly protein TadD